MPMHDVAKYFIPPLHMGVFPVFVDLSTSFASSSRRYRCLAIRLTLSLSMEYQEETKEITQILSCYSPVFVASR